MFPSMEMVSIGPTIEDVHTPRERSTHPRLEETVSALDRLLAGITFREAEEPKTCGELLAEMPKKVLFQ